MTTQQGGELVPEWTLGDRLRKARVMSGMTVAEFADRIGVSDRTINNAEGDKRRVRKITLNAWALATGVSATWLETGKGVPNPPHPGGHPATPSDPLVRLAARKRARHAGGTVTPRYLVAA